MPGAPEEGRLPVNEEEPETSLTRAAWVMLLGATFVGLSRAGWVGVGATSQAFLAGGFILVAGGVVATLRRLYQHWKDRR